MFSRFLGELSHVLNHSRSSSTDQLLVARGTAVYDFVVLSEARKSKKCIRSLMLQLIFQIFDKKF